MRDRASTNNVAMRTMAVVYPSMLDVGCFPHTLDHVGITFTLQPFKILGLHGLVSLPIAIRPECSGGSRQESRWQATVPHWWCSRLEPFFQRNDDIVPTTRAKLLPFFFDQQRKATLQIELAAKKSHAMQPDATAVDTLTAFPFLNSADVITGLKGELPTYLAKAADVDPTFFPL